MTHSFSRGNLRAPEKRMQDTRETRIQLRPRSGLHARTAAACMCLFLPLSSCMYLRQNDTTELSFYPRCTLLRCSVSYIQHIPSFLFLSPEWRRQNQLTLLPQQSHACALRNYHEVSRTVPPPSFGLNRVARASGRGAGEPDLLVRWPPGQITHAKHRLALLQRERAVGPAVARSRSR